MGIPEAVEEFFFLIFTQLPSFREFIGLASLGMHDDGAGFRMNEFINGFFVKNAALPIESHHLGFETIRLHTLQKMAYYMPTDCVYPFRGLDEHRHFRGTLRKIVAVIIAQGIRHTGVGFIYGVFVYVQLHIHSLEMEGQRGFVPDRILE
jgi:hypothetical protein